jgi:prepilin-type N-terminal cleavage/methylation domain-containing protein
MKTEKGFSLLEVIISIATLSIISGFILQMFIVSSQLNHRAKDLDIGASLAINSIERFKRSTASDLFDKHILFEGYLTNRITEQEVELIQGYDADWESIPLSESEYESNQFPTALQFLLKINLLNNPRAGPDEYYQFSTDGGYIQMKGSGQMIGITASVYRWDSSLPSDPFVRIDAGKYDSFF